MPITPEPSDWIKRFRFTDPEIRAKIMKQETKKQLTTLSLRIMANCQSGALAHFAGLLDISDNDNWPRVFNLQHFATGMLPPLHAQVPPANTDFPQSIVYGAFTDYMNNLWSEEHVEKLESGLYEECAAKLAAFIQHSRRQALVILPPAESQFCTTSMLKVGFTEERAKRFNEIWAHLATNHPNLTVQRIGTGDCDIVALPSEVYDAAHYLPPLLRRIGDHIAAWYQTVSSSGQAGTEGLHVAKPGEILKVA